MPAVSAALVVPQAFDQGANSQAIERVGWGLAANVFALGSLVSGKLLFTFVSTFPTPGTYVLTARYGGDETHAGSVTTSELVQTIT
ncbi:MAG: hypothetical protein JWM89_1243 [Acidimicrobiales bacterium]|nr:hypothetical protein [Acidimicrobiales bacterium]